jgi:acyl-CoA reductase-like NAD-dependent aldehyde dehydrogenase
VKHVLIKHLWINGKPVQAVDYTTLYNPYSGEPLAEIPLANETEVNQAIEAAHNAATVMAHMPSHKRAEILERLAHLLDSRAEEAAVIIAQEAAKPIATARGEISRTIQTYKFCAEEAKRITGETLSMDAAPGGEGRVAYTVYEPLGVIGAITPFNFPFNLVAHKIGPAIASGNSIVLKPASQTPLSAFFIAELLKEAGLPDGALNVVTGRGGMVGDQIVKDVRVKKITFTGSAEVGISIRNRAGLKRVTLELGSNSALIIDGNVDVHSMVKRCVTGSFSFQGQVCISLQRIYVHEDVYDSFVEEFIQHTKELVIGNPLEAATDISAMISEREAVRAMEWIEEARSQGVIVAIGGVRQGSIVHPTVLLGAGAKLSVSCQEAFAPIVIINKFTAIEDAIEKVNDSRYGLQAGIYTNDIATAFHAAKRLQVGGVMINDIPSFRVDHMPYGGVKESGLGREGVKYAIQEMVEMKLVVINSG